MDEKTLIESFMPLDSIGSESRREKARKPKNISTMHIYWARRPTISARAAILGGLIPRSVMDEKHVSKMAMLLKKAYTWDFMEDPAKVNEIRNFLKKFHGNEPIRLIDIFAGGGAIPLEGIRLGCETWAVDINPVAYLIQKGILVYPHIFGKKLIKEFEYWINWIGKKAESELKFAYQIPGKMMMPHAFIWAKTIQCPNKKCQAEIPLIKQFWLANKKKKKIALKPLFSESDNILQFKIVKDEEIDFDPKEGLIKAGKARCWKCNSVIDKKLIKTLFKERRTGQRLLVVVFNQNGKKKYEIPAKDALLGFQLVSEKLKQMRDVLLQNGLPLVPQEPAPPQGALGCSTANYGLTTWDKFFNSRQLFSLMTLTKLINEAQAEMEHLEYDSEMKKAISLYLAFTLNRIADYNNILCTWHNRSENIGHLFTRPVLSMKWDYAEINPLNEQASSWWSFGRAIKLVLEHLTTIECKPANLLRGSSTPLPFPDQHFDIVVTDPPFFDNISYSDLSDFFYVWFKRTIGHLFPEVLRWPLSPKSEEIIHSPDRHGSKELSKVFYTTSLTRAFKEAHRILRDDGICIVMFTHKETEAWMSLLKSLIDAGFQITATWPIRMEMTTRMRAMKSAAVGSTILIACRKRKSPKDSIYLPEFKKELQQYLMNKMNFFWNQGIRGIDFFISSIGPAMSVASQYQSVKKLSGETVTTESILDLTSNFCFQFILEKATGKTFMKKDDEITAFYLTWKMIHDNDVLDYDSANKLAKAFQMDLSHLVALGLLEKNLSSIRILPLHGHVGNEMKQQHQRMFENSPLLLLIQFINLLQQEKEPEKLHHLADSITRENMNLFSKCIQLAQVLLKIKSVPSYDKTLLHTLLTMLQEKNYSVANP